MAIEKGVIGNIDGADQISRFLRERFAPGAIDAIFQDLVKFTYFKRTGQNMDTYLMEFDALQRNAEARMLVGRGFSVEIVSV